MNTKKTLVGIIMGSNSNLPVMKEAAKVLEDFGIKYEITIVSAHRTPHRMFEYAKDAEKKEFGGDNCWSGRSCPFTGYDSCYNSAAGNWRSNKNFKSKGNRFSSIYYANAGGVPVATVAINNAKNAGILAAEILGIQYPEIRKRIKQYKEKLRKEVEKKLRNYKNLVIKSILRREKIMIHPIDYRYGSKEMREIFDEVKKLEYQLKVEAALSQALAELGKIPLKAAKEIARKASLKFVKLKRIKKVEKEIGYDVMALVKALTEVCGESGKYVHLTATSYDIVDTAQALQLRKAIEILLMKGKKLLKNCLFTSQKHKDLIIIGRTHGQHAIPITLGFKFANYADKIGEDLERLKEDKKYIYGKFSGVVGNYAAQQVYHLGEELEKKIMKKLGIEKADISTQVVFRENIARIICDIAIFAGTIEQIAKEIRNLQRTEISELSELFGKKTGRLFHYDSKKKSS